MDYGHHRNMCDRNQKPSFAAGSIRARRLQPAIEVQYVTTMKELLMPTCAISIVIGPDTLWLSAVNIPLGGVSLFFVLLIVGAAANELIARARDRHVLSSFRLRSISLRQLGFGSLDSGKLPDEKDLHPGMIPKVKSKSNAHTRLGSA